MPHWIPSKQTSTHKKLKQLRKPKKQADKVPQVSKSDDQRLEMYQTWCLRSQYNIVDQMGGILQAIRK